MKRKLLDKRYIYLRDHQSCFYCKKSLKPNQMTLDHYQPRLLGGTSDYFNLVTCCRRCNRYKGTIMPEDAEELKLKLFKKAVNDGKIEPGIANMKKERFLKLADMVEKIECHGDHSMARGEAFILYIFNNRVTRIDGSWR